MTIQNNAYLYLLNAFFYHSPKLMLYLYNTYSSKEDLLSNVSTIQSQFSLKTKDLSKKIAQFDLNKERILLEKHNIKMLTFEDPSYPALLKECPDYPLLLFYKGELTLINQPQIAIVGPRKASDYGLEVARYFSKELSSYFVLTSGCAEGIDAVTHQMCLNSNRPTIGVIGTGLTKTYPSKHWKLQQDIAEKGLLLSEFPITSPGLQFHFPQRNRLISALSKAVLICEAGKKSGSLITAQFSLEFNKEVYAVPGNIFHCNSQGTHQLIQDGAKCVTHVNDILEDFNLSSPSNGALPLSQPTSTSSTDVQLNGDESIIMHLLSDQPISIDQLISQTSFSIHHLLPMLSLLEIKGIIKQHPGNYYSR